MKFLDIMIKTNRFLFSLYPGSVLIPDTVKRIKLPLPADESGKGFRPYYNFTGSTPGIFKLSSHNSVLNPGVIPHPPHSHRDEEILLLLEGNLDVILPDPDDPDNTSRLKMKPMDILFYPAYTQHTIENTGNINAQYSIFRWETVGPLTRKSPEVEIFSCADIFSTFSSGVNGFVHETIFDLQTVHLDMLNCHISALGPGAGYEPHTDSYDVGIIVLAGELETLGKKASTHDIIYYPAGIPHGMKNTGDKTAVYLVFEFHANPLRTLVSAPSRLLRRIVRN